MLATTIQITNNPPHTTHTHRKKPSRLAVRATTTTRAADAHTVLNVNPTACSSAENFYAQPTKRTHTHHPLPGSKHMQAQENNQHNPTGHAARSPQTGLPRKEVIQPHLPVRLPCYDFVPIANPTFDHSPRKNG